MVTTRRGIRTSSADWADGAHVEGRGRGGTLVAVAAALGDGEQVERGGADPNPEFIEPIEEVAENVGAPVDVERGGAEMIEPQEEVEEDGGEDVSEFIEPIEEVAENVGAPVDVERGGAEMIEPQEEVEEDGGPQEEVEEDGGEDVSDNLDEMTLSQMAAKKKKTKFHRLGYKKTRVRPKRGRVNSDSDSSVSVAPPKKKGGKKTSKNRKSVETTALTVFKDPFKPISESRRADLSSLAKIRDFVSNMPILKTNLWQCIDLGKKLLQIPREEAFELQQDAFRR